MSETITIQLTQGQSTIIDAVDADLAELKWFAAKQKNQFYARRNFNITGIGQTYLLLHRVILERKIGRPLETGEHCDHINGQKLDNRRENLRIATPTQNVSNVGKRKSNKSGFKGVSLASNYSRKKWHAQIQVNGKNIHLGFYETPEEAYEAYKAAAKEHFGEFARLD